MLFRSGIGKTALALKLFGREGVSMIPLLNAGADGIRGMMEEARAFGMVVAPDAAAGASLLSDHLNRLRMAVQGLARTALTELLPVLLDLTHRLIEWIKQSDGVRQAAGILAEAMRLLLFDLQALIVVIRVGWRTGMTALAELGQALSAFGRLVARVWEQPRDILRALIETLKVAVRATGDLAQALV